MIYLKKPGRRNWLRNAAMAATGTLMLLLVLTGCAKEQWDHLKNVPQPGGGVGSTPSGWYLLKVTYQDDQHDDNKAVGYLQPLGGWSPCNNYMVVGGEDKASRFRLHPTEDGWADWEIGNFIDYSPPDYLTMQTNGWVAQDDIEAKVGWKIKDGKLYTNWDYWGDYPMGVEWYDGKSILDLCYEGYYVGANLWNGNVATFELEPW